MSPGPSLISWNLPASSKSSAPSERPAPAFPFSQGLLGESRLTFLIMLNWTTSERAEGFSARNNMYKPVNRFYLKTGRNSLGFSAVSLSPTKAGSWELCWVWEKWVYDSSQESLRTVLVRLAPRSAASAPSSCPAPTLSSSDTWPSAELSGTLWVHPWL